MVRRIAVCALFLLTLFGLAPSALADPASDLSAANALVDKALTAAQQGDLPGAQAAFEEFASRWLQIEDGIRAQSRTAYKAIEDEMGNVRLALVQSQPDQAKVVAALQALAAANRKFIEGGFPADSGKQQATSKTTVADLLTLLDQAKEKIEAGDAAGAAQAIDQFRSAWLDVEGVVLTQSSKVYTDAERDMVEAYALLTKSPPRLQEARVVVTRMRDYLEPLAGKSSYNALDAATILLREGLEALLVVVALLGFLKKAGHEDKSVWIWGGVGFGLLVSVVLAVLVKLLIGTGAFGSNNFLIAGWTGLFAAVMLVYVSYWLHSHSSIAAWQQYIREKSTRALATGNLLSLAALSFLAIFREGTETVLFYIGMASSIPLREMLLGLGIGMALLVVLAVAILKVGLRIPMRPFFLASSILVFYLAFKFTGMGIHGLQLAGVLPATIAPYLPSIDFLAIYPNWESTLPQLGLLLLAGFMAWWTHRRERLATR